MSSAKIKKYLKKITLFLKTNNIKIIKEIDYLIKSKTNSDFITSAYKISKDELYNIIQLLKYTDNSLEEIYIKYNKYLNRKKGGTKTNGKLLKNITNITNVAKVEGTKLANNIITHQSDQLKNKIQTSVNNSINNNVDKITTDPFSFLNIFSTSSNNSTNNINNAIHAVTQDKSVQNKSVQNKFNIEKSMTDKILNEVEKILNKLMKDLIVPTIENKFDELAKKCEQSGGFEIICKCCDCAKDGYVFSSEENIKCSA